MAQRHRVVHPPEREGVLGGALHAEEVGHAAQRQHQDVVGSGPADVSRRRAAGSSPVTSAMRTSTFSASRKMARTG